MIAEIGVNHFDIAEQRGCSPIDAAKKMINEAADAGVDAVKFQSYTADRLTSKHSPAYWDTDEETTDSQYELFQQYDDFGADEFAELADWTDANYDLDFLSTPFDFHAVEYLSEVVPAYKIASADITNHPLLRAIARKEKPILLSTGASTISEIDDAVRVIEDETPDPELCLLHCILQYPTTEENANLGMIDHLSEVYPEYEIGYSDHVPPDSGMITLLNSVFQGADIIEKHFTLDKSLDGNDHYHAMDPTDVRTFRENTSRMLTTTGSSRKEPIAAESDSRTHARRSLVAAKDIERGAEITRDDVAIKRPGTGISPTMLDVVVGRKARKKIPVDAVLSWDVV
ncbi:N-acetylneuraminate synthase family protein [Halorientalis regularis]|uniref:N-acetylneuraminate synthase family protein n=1 Tax=Halorientalis regularis TaxID=660518 RepID=UPI001FDFA1A1|nr:N-acetylneuraminate synthase family protein [Halorientalis regularis]